VESIGAAWLVSALAFAVSMSASPGPNNTMLTASGANFGLRRTVPHMLGISIGFPAMLLAVALGAGELLRAHPLALAVLRWAGAAYLLWLAWRIATARPATPKDGGEPGEIAGRPFSFLQAVLFQWVNPKAWVIGLAAVLTQTTASGAAQIAEAVLLALLFLAVTLVTSVFWILIGVGAAHVLRTPRALRGFNIAMAALLVASLLPLLRVEL
jgi:threonine/homoserine/homoserine lactone efflux protein